MRLFKVITVLISILVSTQTLADSHNLKETEGHIGKMPAPVWLGSDLKYSMPAFLVRATQYLRFSLKREEKKMHESAVFFALTSTVITLNNFISTLKRLAGGKVRVIHSYPISGGYCRTYQAYIKVNGKERHMTNNACKYIGTPSWSFYK